MIINELIKNITVAKDGKVTLLFNTGYVMRLDPEEARNRLNTLMTDKDYYERFYSDFLRREK